MEESLNEKLSHAREQLSAWRKASLEAAKHQSYGVKGRSKALADSSAIRENIKYWQSEVNRLEGKKKGRTNIKYVVPIT